MGNDTQPLEAKVSRPLAAGQRDAALRAWQRILAIAPDHLLTLTSVGKFSLRTGGLVLTGPAPIR